MGLTNISEPNALLHFSNQLKMIAEEYNIAMATSMQLNDNYKTAEIIDESCLYSSKAVKTKLDNGCITTYPREKDIKQVDGLISKWNRKIIQILKFLDQMFLQAALRQDMVDMVII